MYFNSYIFILAFLPIVLCGYYLINKTKKYRLGQMWLLAASLMFIGYLNTWYTVFAALCICIGYLFLICVTNKDKRVRIIGLTAGLPVTLQGLIGDNGISVGLEHFGFSAPFDVLDHKFGFTGEAVFEKVVALLNK